MMRLPSRPARRGFTLLDLVVAITAIALLIGVLLPAVLNAREADKANKSQNNLKNLGLALQAYSGAHNNTLPNAGKQAPFFFCGQMDGVASKGPKFENGILSHLEGNTKSLVAPEDVNVGNSKPADTTCCYSIPAYWAKLSNGTGNLFIPFSFMRGTSQCLAFAEMTTQDVGYMKIRPFDLAPYELAEKDKASTTANSFSPKGCQVVLVDGTVKLIKKGANAPKNGDFILAQQPDDVTNKFSKEW
jgi:type II secretory pathway pseudopilin PulG